MNDYNEYIERSVEQFRTLLTEQLARDNTPVYLTVDLDCLDPSGFSGTGTPEAGGVCFTQLLYALFRARI